MYRDWYTCNKWWVDRSIKLIVYTKCISKYVLQNNLKGYRWIVGKVLLKCNPTVNCNLFLRVEVPPWNPFLDRWILRQRVHISFIFAIAVSFLYSTIFILNAVLGNIFFLYFCTFLIFIYFCSFLIFVIRNSSEFSFTSYAIFQWDFSLPSNPFFFGTFRMVFFYR